MSEFQAWKADPTRYFGATDPTFEKLRKPWPIDSTKELVETSYFGFSIPEEKIHCEVYHWAHPMYGLTSGGIAIFKGIKHKQANAEFIEYRNYQPLPDDITDCTYADGVKIRMIKPMEEFEISFDDPAGKVSLNFVSRAIMPPAFRPTGGHITQALKTTGSLTLHGKTYKIDSYFTRDRSWGDPRSEAVLDIAPIGWHCGVFGDDLAFHITAFESADMNPALAKRYPALTENGKNHIWGYVWKKGQLLGIKSCSKVMQRDSDGLAPAAMVLHIVDENDQLYKLKGVAEARLPMCVWPNMNFFFGLMSWTLEGEKRTGWGELQEVYYQDYVRENSTDADAPAKAAK